VRFLIFSILILGSCSEQPSSFLTHAEMPIRHSPFNGKVVIESLSEVDGFRLSLYHEQTFTDRAIFKYKPYKLDTGDVNRDGVTDILVGLIKPTKFDPTEKKRLFIIRIDDGQLRPLWLGTRVCQELYDFKSLDNGIIQTIEKTKKGNYAVGQYRWQSFGLTLITYLHNEISLTDAVMFFHQ
jgi:hypothetical protein